MKMKIKLQLFTILFLFSSINFAQSKLNAPYIGLHFGASSNENAAYQKIQNSPEFVFGGNFGIPLYKNLSLYTRATYFVNNDFSGNASYFDPSIQVYNQATGFIASFSQLVINFGLQYSIPLFEEVNLGFAGGLTYSLVDHEAKFTSGQLIQKLDNEGVFGYFGGANVEKRFSDSDFALYAEALYNYADKDVIYFRDKFSGMNFTFGGKYYFVDY